jgi:hypothetical protein
MICLEVLCHGIRQQGNYSGEMTDVDYRGGRNQCCRDGVEGHFRVSGTVGAIPTSKIQYVESRVPDHGFVGNWTGSGPRRLC